MLNNLFIYFRFLVLTCGGFFRVTSSDKPAQEEGRDEMLVYLKQVQNNLV
jgi:hypothetical protein